MMVENFLILRFEIPEAERDDKAMFFHKKRNAMNMD